MKFTKLEKIEGILLLLYAVSVIVLKLLGHIGIGVVIGSALLVGLIVVWFLEFVQASGDQQVNKPVMLLGMFSKMCALPAFLFTGRIHWSRNDGAYRSGVEPCVYYCFSDQKDL